MSNSRFNIKQLFTYSLLGTSNIFVYAASNTCLQTDYVNACSESPLGKFVGPLTPLDVLKKDYCVITNTANFNDIKLFFVANRHDMIQHHLLAKQFIKTWGGKNPIVLVEGLPNDARIPYDAICINKLPKVMIFNPAKYPNRIAPECVITLDLPKEAIVNGWENRKAFNAADKDFMKAQAFSEPFYKLHSAYENFYFKDYEKFQVQISSGQFTKHWLLKEIKNLLAKMSKIQSETEVYLKKINQQSKNFNLTRLQEAIKYFENNMTNSDSFKLIDALMHDMDGMKKTNHFFAHQFELQDLAMKEAYHASHLSARNKGLINTLGMFKSKSGKKIVLSGANHFVPDCEKQLFEANSTDPQYEFQQSIKDTPYAILIPRLGVK